MIVSPVRVVSGWREHNNNQKEKLWLHCIEVNREQAYRLKLIIVINMIDKSRFETKERKLKITKIIDSRLKIEPNR